MRTEVVWEQGMTLVCLHHKYTGLPFMEMQAQRISFKYDIKYDHDLVVIDFEEAVMSDLTLWPKTVDPYAFDYSKLHGKSIHEFIAGLKRQGIIGIKDKSKRSSLEVVTKMYSAECPLKPADCSMQCHVKFENASLEYFQQQFMRLVTYFNNRLVYALTRTYPYDDRDQSKIQMTDEEINNIKDLCQPDFDMDLRIDFYEAVLRIKERPYLDSNCIDFLIDRIKITHTEDSVKGKHRNLPDLQMKQSKMNYLLEKVLVHHIQKKNGSSEVKSTRISDPFDLDFTMISPNYSETLE